MSSIGLLDYGMGNLHSVQRAFERLSCRVCTVQRSEAMAACDALVLPGVGAFDPAMEQLHRSGLASGLTQWCNDGRPLLGICLGLQLLFEGSDEGSARGLGLIPGHVRALPRDRGEMVPHMGWSPLQAEAGTPLLRADEPATWVYFVHSYAAVPERQEDVAASVRFAGEPITAAVWHRNVAACQFHPEKSGLHGQRLLRRWLESACSA
ncbi:imidazole glycerol phosphate synthase subunit HisH [Synechococcus sp. RSCCF101]|uniref:imidazole glycerol phosphate synthase subunit HisH n=1 Tax=Synechococcus sp. RSCCF101 TaxID=2511069 RepID=UPI00124824FF|nr:imidazole glycerol phosphate synthase subunit HisH [Synechococcus sp. RSCCF101]QEY30984.1 imidazole glycerol phosphate synthase subunit HisH [Synechococcus sp. RSCCF101]